MFLFMYFKKARTQSVGSKTEIKVLSQIVQQLSFGKI